MNTKLSFVPGLAVVAGLAVAIYLAFNTYVIGAHEVGVVVDEGVIEGVAGPEWHITALMEDIVKIPTVPQQRQVKGLSMATKDNFAMTDSVIGFTYRIPENKAKSLYRDHPGYEAQMKTQIAKSAKNTVGQYNLVDVPQNRAEIENHIRSCVNAFIESKLGIAGMVTNVSLAYYGWEPRARTFLSSIQESKQQIRLAELDKRRDAIDRENKAEDAEMKAKNRLIRAKSEKKAKVLRARGDAKAERLRNAATLERLHAMVDLLGEQRAVKVIRWRKWDGRMPQVVGGGQSLALEQPIRLGAAAR